MVVALAALVLAADPSPARPPAASRTVTARLVEVVLAERRAVLEASDGRIGVSLDRNTMVFLDNRQGTVRDLTAGTPVRAGIGPGGEAHWIELRPRGAVATGVAGSPQAVPPPPEAAAPPAGAPPR